MARWWSRKYRLPANHRLFASQTEAELRLEMYEDMLDKRQSLRDALDDLDRAGASKQVSQAREHLRQDINTLNIALGDPIEEDDPLIARWERELAEGKMPNLRER